MLPRERLNIAMLSVHSSPLGELGSQDTGGMSVYIRELAEELGRRGHRVDIFTRLQDSQSDRTVRLSEKVRLIHLRAGANGHLHKWALHPHLADFWRELEGFRAEQRIRYDLVHSHYWLSGLVGNWASDQWEVPHIILFHTLGALKNLTVEAEREPDFRLEVERELVETCDRILAPTLRERDNLLRYYGARLEKIGVVPCGVNLELFRPIDRGRARRHLGFSPNEAVVLFVGRFAPLKGIERLLAAATLLQEPRRLRLVIVGGSGDETPESQGVRRLSEAYGIRGAVTLAGRIAQDQLPPYYSAADVLVVPSYYESFGLVALESLACGTPVVATDVGAMPSILREGVNGWVVSEGSPLALAQGIDRVLGSARLFSGEIVRGSVLRFAWKHVAAAVIDEYNILLRRRRGDSDSLGTVAALALGACASASAGRG
ncbi:MAG TPA: glycosyltransferase [Syntrophobacteria bacterium]|nr:glycosyltransferase [Syntrophobacteria bacterium]